MVAAVYSPWALLILAAIIVLLFGGKRLVGAGRGLGSGIREFKDSITGHEPEEQKELTPRRTPVDRDDL
jgi:sec-independent protein translocase protein TatA